MPVTPAATGINTFFGAWAGPDAYPPDQTKAEMRATVCARYGVSSLPVERVFNGTSLALPATGTGHQIISFDHNPDDVLAGKLDAAYEGFVGNLNPANRYWLVYRHEADNPYKKNNAAKQVEAFKRFHTIIHGARPSAKVKTAPILMAYTLFQGQHAQWIPPTDYYDQIGFDSYWRPQIFNTASAVFQPLLDYAGQVEKRLIIGETSCGAVHNLGEDQYGEPLADSVYTTFTAEAVPLLDGSDWCKAVCWFEGVNSDGDGRLKNHATGLATWSAAVQGS